MSMFGRAIILAWALLVVGIWCAGQQPRAQIGPVPGQVGPLGGVGVAKAPSGPPGYAGPGDIVSAAAFWWGLRCYNAAYAGNVADIQAPADASHTVLTCSAGGTINETLQALSTTCAISCTAKTLYDQSGNTNCASVACDLTNATIANRPAYTLSCIGSLGCLTFTGTLSQILQAAGQAPSSFCPQPLTVSLVAKRTGTFTSFNTMIGNDGAVVQTGFSNSANTALVFAGSVATASAADSAWHAMQVVYNGSSSIAYIDGASTGSLVAGSNGFGNKRPSIGGNQATNFSTGTFGEGGFWCSAFTGGNQSSMDGNQRAYWGF